jgi:hypothetical protein
VTDSVAVLEAVAANCPDLEWINLGMCDVITDGGLEAIAAGCPCLTSLGLYRCDEVTDAGIEEIFTGCCSPGLLTSALAAR